MKKLLLVVMMMLIASVARAIPVTLGAAGQDLLTVHFSLPAQPSAHNALLLGAQSSSGPVGGISGTTVLFNGTTVLATATANFLGQRYASAGSFFSGIDPLIDFSQLASGTTAGRWTFQVTSGVRSFDTDDWFVRPFGDGGSQVGFDATVTRVTVSSSSASVPGPPTAWLLVCAGVLALRRRSARLRGTRLRGARQVP